MTNRVSAEDGFSIIEALVAALIAGVAVTQFYDGLGTGLRLDATTSRQARETLTALSALDSIREQAAQGTRFLPGQTLSGDIDGIRWTANMRDAAAGFALGWMGPGAVTSVNIAIKGRKDNPVVTGYIPGVAR